MPVHRPLFAVVALALALAAPAAAETPIASLARPTEVASDAGVTAVSRWDGSAFRLAVSEGDGPLRDLPVAPRPASFQADVGTDTRGKPELVYVRCGHDAADERERSGCGLFVYPLPGGPERAVASVAAPHAQATHPTLWRGRVAWVRTYASGRQVVYERNLRDGRAKASVRLDGAAPARTCASLSGRCVPTREVRFEALQLTDRWLASVSDFTSSSPVGASQTELRLVDVLNDGRSRQVAFQVSGNAGQTITGPSFARGYLGWALSCTGEPGGCTTKNAGYWRYALGGQYQQVPGPVRVHGFALQADGSAIEQHEDGALVHTDPLPFARARRAPRPL
jgi:hypothetical protein